MKPIAKRSLGVFLTLVTLLSMLPSTFAFESDITGHWAEEALQSFIDDGYLAGDGNGHYMPDSTHVYTFDGIYIKPVYRGGAVVTPFFTEGSAEVAISGIPGDLEDVTATIVKGSGRGSTTVANAVEMSAAPGRT